MSELDAGIFVFLIGIVLFTFIAGMKYSISLLYICLVLLFILSALMFTSPTIQFIQTTNDGTTITTTTSCLICENQNWLSNIFLGIGFVVLFKVVIMMLQSRYTT